MNPALTRLLLLRLRGGIRYRARQLASLRGVTFLIVVASIVWLAVGGHLSSPNQYSGNEALQDPHHLREHIDTFMPLGLLGACLFTAAITRGSAFYFSPTEINLLLAGPFSRRDLILYKFHAYLTGAILSAALITLLVPSRISTVIACFIGSLLTLLFIQLSSAVIGMLNQAFEQKCLIRSRKISILSLFTIACVGLFYKISTTGTNIVDVLTAFRHSRIGIITLGPFIIFAKLFLVQTIIPNLFTWAALAIAVNATMLQTIIALDSHISDRSLTDSWQRSNRWMRIKRGGSFWASADTTVRSVPRSPRLGGAGPIIWRQAINAMRNSGRVVLVFFSIAASAGPISYNAHIAYTNSEFIGFVYFFFAFVIPRSLVCDFRGDLENISLYKSLPIDSWAVCVGQITVPVSLTSIMQLTMGLSMLSFLNHTSLIMLYFLLLFTIPFNVILYSVENIMFLWIPTKLVPVGRVDFDFLGRAVVDFIVKTIIIFAALAIARTAGLAAQRAAGQSWLAFGIAAWLALALIGSLTIPLLVCAFRRFSVSQTLK